MFGPYLARWFALVGAFVLADALLYEGYAALAWNLRILGQIEQLCEQRAEQSGVGEDRRPDSAG